MSPTELLAHPLCQAVTLALVHFLWQGLVVALGLAAVVGLLGIRRPGLRYVCSLAAFLLMAMCPVGTLAWHYAEETTLSGASAGESSRATASLAPSIVLAATTATARQPAQFLVAAQPLVLTLWLTGVALFGGRLLMGLAGLGLLRRDRLPLPADLSARVREQCRRLGLPVRPLVFFSRRISEAMAVGFVRPLVLIPAVWATEMPPAMLEAVIAHELAHVRRGDLWINLFQRVVETLLFYHPAVWWLSRRLRVERELCCDELAVAVTGQRLEYVQSLEHVARRRAAVARPVLAAGIRGENDMRLLERVRNVLGNSAAPERSLWPAGLLALVLPLGIGGYATGLFTAVAAVTAQEERSDPPAAKSGEREREQETERDAGKKGEREREGDRPREEDRERERDQAERKEARRDGDRPREGERPREGDDPNAARLKRERIEEAKFFGRDKELLRDGDRPAKERPRDGEARKEGPRDGDRPRKEGARDGDRPREGDNDRVAELMAMVKRLTAENQRLRAELAEIRGDKVREKGPAEKEVIARDRKIKEAEATRREAEERKREAAEQKEAQLRERKIKDEIKKDSQQ